jgi:polysaccharide deacetylase family protein (PEP-CTERM system associated)
VTAGARDLVNAFTVDVEDYFHVAALSAAISRERWESLPQRVEGNTNRLLDLLDETNTKATFFVLGWVAQRFPELIREVARRGHEVASHGFSHQLVYSQSEQEFRSETLRSKGTLEDLLGAAVIGYRAASYSITKKSLWALDILSEAGFLYDSSIFPVHHDRYGVPDAPRRPHVLQTPAGNSLVEFPPTVVRILGQNVPCSGGGYFRIYPYWLTRTLLRRVNRAARQPFIFYLHPWEIDADQPRFEAGRLSKFRHYTRLDQCEARLERLLSEFRFDTARAVLRSLGLLGG